MRIIFALKTFFQILFSAAAAQKIEAALTPVAETANAGKSEKQPGKNTDKKTDKVSQPQPQPVEKIVEKIVEKVVEKKVFEKPVRSDALTLLASLQREARFIDFLQEDIQPFDDAQIGAIVRDVHRGCAQTIKRMFEIEPLSDKAEGETISLEPGFDPLLYKIDSTDSLENGAVEGTVVHPGWKATRCEFPVWTGGKDSALIVAPIEIEK